jgi:hypothetical protein
VYAIPHGIIILLTAVSGSRFRCVSLQKRTSELGRFYGSAAVCTPNGAATDPFAPDRRSTSTALIRPVSERKTYISVFVDALRSPKYKRIGAPQMGNQHGTSDG